MSTLPPLTREHSTTVPARADAQPSASPSQAAGGGGQPRVQVSVSAVGKQGVVVQGSWHQGAKVLVATLESKFPGVRLAEVPTYAKSGSGIAQFEPPSAEEVANRVLGFVENRLRLEQVNGASQERLSNLLSQARKGVEQGFKEAREIIRHMGLETPELNAQINESYERIQVGLTDAEQRYLGTAAQPQTGTAAPVRAAAQYTQARSEQVGIQVRTRDGDLVTIALNRLQAGQASLSLNSSGAAASSPAGGGAGGVSLQGAAIFLRYENYALNIEGELDEDEIRALEDLLRQVDEVANAFFGGDLGQAFERALKIGFDSERLASFSVGMTQVSMAQQTRAYREIADLDRLQGAGHRLDESLLRPMRHYAQGLVRLIDQAGAFPQPGKLFQDLLKPFMEDRAASAPTSLPWLEFLESYTPRLLERLRAS